MKRTLSSIIIVAGIFVNLQAQTTPKARFQVSYPDLSNKFFFDQHPNLNRIVISYKNDTAVTLNLSFRQTTRALNNELYYLTFEGDRYLLHKKYETLIVPKPVKLTMQYFQGIQDQSRTGYKLETTLRRDSITHHFSYYTLSGGDVYPERSLRNRAKFNDDVVQLQKKLIESIRQWKPIVVSDSVLVVTGIVERDGSFGNLGLKSGSPSPFSKKILEFIEREAVSWSPAWQNARTVRYQVRFFVRLNRDESISLSVF